MSNTDVVLRHPVLEDGTAVFDLVDACKPLDLNSHYLYLLQCSHFAPTCVVATLHGEVVAWVSGYIPPKQTDTFFVWQVAVGEKARGLGLGKHLINWVLAQQNGIKKIHTSITPDNAASWGLFKSLARDWGSDLSSQDWFEEQSHFGGRHNTEVLVEIALPTTPLATFLQTQGVQQ
ncbi:L-2,4-diaminobutyric acid acetyltransferase [Limnobacter sp. 130]|jgi:L-2,4-diaminobutyric acid acetyltransferase|uniref:diaminobutyrate acetyltransferase n=1 Tax=Limnobacter sp. 130 TaxID=2653147 RepID=UPI0012F19F7C|nr:diaminobutyrate acetyltransferase [Limnobacter sp. 130]VWX35494.1 L-2,4-diaminobutyric acid acetyltransferase [Limnobacter sp. 130]